MSAPERWHAGRVMLACSSYFNWFENRMMTEFWVDGGRADLVFVSKAGYLTEIEIKVSHADWNADRSKLKFARPRPHVARFFYAVPDVLAKSIPDWVPDYAGILEIRGGVFADHAHELRAAKRLKALKLPEHWERALVENTYHRYWRQQLRALRAYRADQGGRGEAAA